TALAAVDPVAALRALHVRWVLVEDGLGAGPASEQLRSHGATTAYDGDGLVLLDLGTPERAPSIMPSVTKHQDIVLICDAAGVLLLLGGAIRILRGKM
ncbi:MAG TPA: hypothetical protein VN088_20765, partial [Nocardioides sp.]|nr:hypothetical protein [Nocardioides sp.]